MSSKSPLNIEHSLYIAILIVALAIRLIGLGDAPLTEAEAQAALPAYQIAERSGTALGSQPGYVLLTGALFSLASANEFLARLWPAIFGAALVLLPYLWRDVLGRPAALLLALGLAVDPGLIAYSRAASGVLIGLSAALWALSARRAGRPAWAGILVVIALYASPHLYVGVLSFGLAMLAFERVSSKKEQDALAQFVVADQNRMRTFLVSALFTILLGGSWLLSLPAGLAASAAPIVAFFTRIATGGGDGLSLILLAFLAYGLLPLVFGGLGAVQAWRERDPLGRYLALFAAAALVLVLANPGRQVADLIWVLLPLWILAAQTLAQYLQVPEDEPVAAFGQLALVLLLSAFLVLNLARVSGLRWGDPELNLRLLTAGGVVGLGIIASVMIAYGWSRQAARHGLAWSFAILLLMANLAAGWRLAHREIAPNDLWLPGPAAGQMRLLESVVEGISEMQTGELRQLAVEDQTGLASVAWTLRNYTAVDGSVSGEPSVIIAGGSDPQPVETAAYRGQSHVWQIERAWIAGWPENVIAWWFYRDGITLNQEIILWARADLFPGGLDNVESEIPIEPASP